MSEYPAGRAMVVVLEPGLHVSRWNGIALNIRDLPGVQNVTDLNHISQATLDVLLQQPTPRLRREDPASYHAIRHYWRLKQQAWLF